ncbi:DNA polymerase V [Pantoea ananatis]|uniref:DNA polymerase V n=1 Tax=Pantoea ananas TaxID=553 RepID=UPI000CF4C7F5|nr:DNA polymerase V [Pantoea ananatis]PQL04017.1 DNA polymerase V [Pantoea ananatis]
MPRYGDIRVSFHEAMRRNPKFGVTVSTSDFVAELAKRNWGFNHRQAAQNVMTSRDQSPEEDEDKLWQRFYHCGEY